MKKLLFILIASAITFSSCNDDGTYDFVGNSTNLLDGSIDQIALKNSIKVNITGYPKSDMGNINCIPDVISEANLKDELEMVGSFEYAGKLFHIIGNYQIHDCSYNADTKTIRESFTAIFEDHEGDRLYINGFVNLSHDQATGEENLYGEWKINSDSQKYAGNNGFVIISGKVNFNSGIKTFKGQGLL
jgi:hypothetical protein